MAYAVVQTKTVAGSTTQSPALTFDSTTTSGNLIIVAVASWVNNVNSVSDNKGNTFTAIEDDYNYLNHMSLYYAYNITGGSSHIVTVNGSSGGWQMSVIIREYSGIETTAPYDKTAKASGSSNTPTSGTTAATTTANQLVLGVAAQSTTATLSAGTGFGNASAVSASNSSLGIQDKRVTSTGTQSSTMNSTVSWSYGAIVATFKESGGGGGATPKNLTLLGVG